ncbi:MAG: type I-G CRISPR-associated protein Cas8g1/Csx17 [Actinomycetota bacterium]
MNVHHLRGCRPEPLGSYLKALGVLRLLGEQVDPDATGHWEGETFVLGTELDRDALLAFFLDEYRPTPLVAPWNGGSGFGPKDQQAGIAALEASSDPRVAAYREAITAARSLVAEAGWDDLSKEEQVERCRSTLPDAAVSWLDATVVLTASSRAFPPLLGTGGNVGRLEFSNNFMQRVAQVLCIDSRHPNRQRRQSEQWLHRSLLDSGTPKLIKAAIGQFDPGAAGGANSSPLGDAGSLLNPWDYVLLLEGSLLFSSGAARRLGADLPGKASIPFTVDATQVGYLSSAADEKARGELWTPLWIRPATAGELERLAGEGRAEWRGRQARTGLDFARAVGSLAVDRGITAFARHSFVERHGQNMLAVPTGRVLVRSHREAPILGAFDPWLNGIRGARSLPHGVAAKLRAVDTAMWEVAVRGGAVALQTTLSALAELERAVSRSGNLRRDRVRAPVTPLSAEEWLPLLDDGSPELRLAAAIASQRDPKRGGTVGPDSARSRAITYYLRPVQLGRARRLEWAEADSRVPGIGTRPLAYVLGEVLWARGVDAFSLGSPTREGDGEEGQRGVDIAFRYSCPVPMEDTVAYLERRVDDARLEELLGACLLLDWHEQPDVSSWNADSPGFDWSAPPAWQLLVPFFQSAGAGAGPPLRPGASWVPLLLAGRVVEVLDDAVLRLRIARRTAIVGLTADAREAMSATVSPERLAAALLIPISGFVGRWLLDRVSVTSPDEPLSQPSAITD